MWYFIKKIIINKIRDTHLQTAWPFRRNIKCRKFEIKTWGYSVCPLLGKFDQKGPKMRHPEFWDLLYSL